MALFRSRAAVVIPLVEPILDDFPEIDGAEIAATIFGKRIAGDFYDSLRVGPERILFGLLDVAGRRENNRLLLSTAQNVFRARGVELFPVLISTNSKPWLSSVWKPTPTFWKPPKGCNPVPRF